MTTNYTAAISYRQAAVEYDGDSGVSALVAVNVAGVSASITPKPTVANAVRVGGISAVLPPEGVLPPKTVRVAGVAAVLANRNVQVLVGGIAATTFNGAGLWKKTADGWTPLHGYHKLSNGDWLRLI